MKKVKRLFRDCLKNIETSVVRYNGSSSLWSEKSVK